MAGASGGVAGQANMTWTAAQQHAWGARSAHTCRLDAFAVTSAPSRSSCREATAASTALGSSCGCATWLPGAHWLMGVAQWRARCTRTAGGHPGPPGGPPLAAHTTHHSTHTLCHSAITSSVRASAMALTSLKLHGAAKHRVLPFTWICTGEIAARLGRGGGCVRIWRVGGRHGARQAGRGRTPCGRTRWWSRCQYRNTWHRGGRGQLDPTRIRCG